MTGSRIGQAQPIFESLVNLLPEERDEALTRACGDDDELRTYVSRLLENHDRGMGSFLEAPRTPEADADPGEAFPSVQGYEVLRRVGEGGMGVVYEAKQQNPLRAVALKVIRGGAWISDRQVQLFDREVKSLARLTHPSIASIFDAGRTNRGRPFFTMEFVEGSPLSEVFDAALPDSGSRARDDIRGRLRIFLQVCDAIGYAHQRGVIHRDLKPANVLVTKGASGASGPAVKVLDFGLARIIDADVSLATTRSEMGRIQGTLAYMSPEQARGDPDAIDTRTDIYSLGIILYELLTGALPYDTRKLAIHEALRIICEEPPVPPSRLARALRGDLETIVSKAIAKEPERRYPTAVALADDLRRYLGARPILAHPASTMYQLRMLVARNRLPFAFVAALFVVLMVSTVVTSVLYEGQKRERNRAEREAETARQTTDFLVGLFESTNPYGDGAANTTARELLETGARRIRTELHDHPEVRGDLLYTIGRLHNYLGLGETADSLLREAEATLGADDPKRGWALWSLGETCVNAGDLERGRAYFHEALRIFELAHGRLSRPAAEVLNDLGLLEFYAGDSPEGERLMREALRIAESILEDPETGSATEALPGTDRDQTLRARILGPMAIVLQAQGKWSEAEEAYREAIRVYREAGDRSTNYAIATGSLGRLLCEKGRAAEAGPFFRETLEVSRRMRGDESGSVARSLFWIGYGAHLAGDSEEAEAALTESIALYERSQEDPVRSAASSRRRADSLEVLAMVMKAQGRADRALSHAKEAMDAYRVAAESPGATAAAINEYAWALVSCEIEEARDPTTAVAQARKAVAMSDGANANFLDTLAHAHFLSGDYEVAIATAERALAVAHDPPERDAVSEHLATYREAIEQAAAR